MNSDSLWAQSAQQFQQMLTQGWSQALESFQKMDLGANKAPMAMRMAPEKLQALQTQYLQEATELWQKSLQGQVAAEDRRFADVSWAQNPLAAFSAAAYLLNARTMTQLAEAHRLAQRTARIIRQNLIFAMGAMVVLVTGALFFDLPLPLAVIGHEGGTVLVVLNGLRLLTDQIRKGAD